MNGKGYTQEVARYHDPDELQVRVGFFAADILLSLTYEKVPEDV